MPAKWNNSDVHICTRWIHQKITWNNWRTIWTIHRYYIYRMVILWPFKQTKMFKNQYKIGQFRYQVLDALRPCNENTYQVYLIILVSRGGLAVVRYETATWTNTRVILYCLEHIMINIFLKKQIFLSEKRHLKNIFCLLSQYCQSARELRWYDACVDVSHTSLS